MSYIKPLTILLFIIFSKNLFAAENFYNFEYSKNDLKNISKNWVYNSGILKDTQNKIIQFNDKLIHLDGYKNLLILSLIDGKEVCKNIGNIYDFHHTFIGNILISSYDNSFFLISSNFR